ncbi:MAG: hypothetical protein CMH83_17035 [Nocardioides sp.]|nr:hypothetical protein [Nocardioides sp.]
MQRRRALGLASSALVLALLAALAVVVLTTADDSPGRARGQAGGEPVAAVGTPSVAPRLRGEVAGTIGVLSFNALKYLGPKRALHDWRRVARRTDVDLIGWQETRNDPWADAAAVFEGEGWRTWQYPDLSGPKQLAVSWRPDVLRLVDVTWQRVHDGATPRETERPFPARYVVRARFVHRASGLTVTLLNTHLNHAIETGHGFDDNLNARRAKQHLRVLSRMWDRTPGDVVLGTGDYNFDQADDAAYRPAGGISRRFAGRAVSSYDALGTDGVVPTLRTRWIDYVWVSAATLRGPLGAGPDGHAQLVTHRSLGGYRSDHRPLLARVRLYA